MSGWWFAGCLVSKEVFQIKCSSLYLYEYCFRVSRSWIFYVSVNTKTLNEGWSNVFRYTCLALADESALYEIGSKVRLGTSSDWLRWVQSPPKSHSIWVQSPLKSHRIWVIEVQLDPRDTWKNRGNKVQFSAYKQDADAITL